MSTHESETDDQSKIKQANKIYWASGIVSICGIIFEILLGAAGSYVLGDSVKQYAFIIGLFLTGMGIGAAISEKVSRQLISFFILIELGIGLIGGFSILALFAVMAYLDPGMEAFYLYSITLLIGGLTGLELPLLIRKATEIGVRLNRSAARVLFSDYAGSLIGSVLFALYLRHSLGLVKTAFVVALVNVLIALWMLYTFRDELLRKKSLLAAGILAFVLLFGGIFTGEQLVYSFEQKLYRDPVLDIVKTPYQKIVITRNQDDIRMFLNGNLQFSSSDEYRYHETLVHPAMSLAEKREHILVLGGGDGLAARELLKYPEVETITVVDLDRELVEYVKHSQLISQLNKHSLEHEKVHVVHADAFQFLRNHKQSLYDVIIADLPDPNNEGLNKLYTREFYGLIQGRLMPGGVFVTQATSPLFAREAYWTISHTMASAGFRVAHFHTDIPSFGDWGFVMGFHPKDTRYDGMGTDAFRSTVISGIQLEVPTRYLKESVIPGLFAFGKDADQNIIDQDGKKISLQVNTLHHPVLLRIYEQAWRYY
ncbi:MAG: polyamine aminopropyltransferase [Bacillaceae bacterium]|nr:polyamine aminopropyltransferase [Bacillaceae bacterium]